jgi:hypothetical protein
MRKGDREITDRAELEEVLRAATVMRLGLAVEDVPYVVPLNFGYEDGRVYFHCAREGKKLEMIERNDLVCFEVEAEYELHEADKPCAWTAWYKSLIGWGRARVVRDPEERMRGFRALMRHVAGREYEDGDFPEEHADLALIVAVDVERMTGKKHHRK